MNISTIASEESPRPDQTRWFTEEVHSHDGQLKAYLRVSFPSVRDVEDIVQESYVRIWHRHLATPITSAKAFLFRIARNIAIDNIRTQIKSPMAGAGDIGSLPIIAEDTGAEDAAAQEKKFFIVSNAMAVLPPRGREVFILRKIEGYSQKGTAAKLGISEKTVDEHLSRALKKLGAHVKKLGLDQAFDP
jgi:RNA polymerase sigma-70 factor (ECF subfamily)